KRSRLTYADIGIYLLGGPLLHDVGRLQRDWRCAPPRHLGHTDRRREGGRDDRDRPLAVPAPGLETPTGAQRGRTRQLSGGGAPSVVQPGTRASSSVPRLVGQVRAGVE